MKAEIIAVGSEMLTPAHLDTNSLFLTHRLNAAGFELHLKTVVGDDSDDIREALCAALGRSRLIVITGGLGPTEDDLTRDAVAAALGRRLALDPGILAGLRKKILRRSLPSSRLVERQAETIEGARVLPNDCGTAPGMWIQHGDAVIVLLPGPPRELEAMFESQVEPLLAKLSPFRRLASLSFRVTGMMESQVDGLVSPIYRQYPEVQAIVLAGKGFIGLQFLRRLAPGENSADLEELSAKIRAALGDAIFTESDESLEAVVGRMLREAGLTLAVAESCTSGLMAARITAVPGSSDYFLGGILCYSNDVKTGLCGVPADVLHRHGAVSAETAEALARGIRERLGSSIGLSITGIAGPGGGSEEKPVGLVWFGLADGAGCATERRVFGGGREAVRERAAAFALTLLRSRLLGKGKGGQP